MRRGTLLTQVLLVNLLLIAAAVVAASIAANPDSSIEDGGALGLVLGFALAAAVAINVYLLSRRFEPLEAVVEEMESADLSHPGLASRQPELDGPEEVQRIHRAFREMLARLEAERREGASTALRAQERERARIALDLHDEVNQSLTAVLLLIEALRRKADPQLEPDLAETSAVASQAMEELLRIARHLRPTVLDDLGLEAALATLVEETAARSGVAAAFESEADLAAVSDDVQLVTYRVAQEALSNAVQHGSPRRIAVRLGGSGGSVLLDVVDDGAGFIPGDNGSGLGIAGMRERALLCGGTLEVASAPGAGTRVTLRA
jgi:two-component system sensor histidine kinase UhpB